MKQSRIGWAAVVVAGCAVLGFVGARAVQGASGLAQEPAGTVTVAAADDASNRSGAGAASSAPTIPGSAAPSPAQSSAANGTTKATVKALTRTTPKATTGPDVAVLRRAVAGLDVTGVVDRQVVRLPEGRPGDPRYRVTLTTDGAQYTVELFQVDASVRPVCSDGQKGCRVEAWATDPNSQSYAAPDRVQDDGRTLVSTVEVRLSYVVRGERPWAARVVWTGPTAYRSPGAEQLRGIGTGLAMAFVPPEAISGH